MFLRTGIIFCVVLALLLAGCTTTPTVNSGAVVVESEDFHAAIIFSDSDRQKIRDFYRTHRTKGLPPGLAKKEESHPGLRRHLEKYRELPSGIEENRLPEELEGTLSRLPDGYVRLWIEGDVVLLHSRTRYVLDIMFDID